MVKNCYVSAASFAKGEARLKKNQSFLKTY